MAPRWARRSRPLTARWQRERALDDGASDQGLGAGNKALTCHFIRRQYSSGDFADACRRHGVRRSMGRIGSSYDNALAEALFATLKRELDVDRRRWAIDADARRDVFRWIVFYNHRRRHSTLGYLSPADYEQTLTPTTLHQFAA